VPRNSEWQWVNTEYNHSMVCFWPIRIFHCSFCSHFNARKFLLWWGWRLPNVMYAHFYAPTEARTVWTFLPMRRVQRRVCCGHACSCAFMQSFLATRDPLKFVVMKHFLFRTSSINYFQYGAKPYWLARKEQYMCSGQERRFLFGTMNRPFDSSHSATSVVSV
jgi:hypothetical protein